MKWQKNKIFFKPRSQNLDFILILAQFQSEEVVSCGPNSFLAVINTFTHLDSTCMNLLCTFYSLQTTAAYRAFKREQKLSASLESLHLTVTFVYHSVHDSG